MTTQQKLDFSREIRQWLGMGVSMLSVGLSILVMVKPEIITKLTNKIIGEAK